MSRNSPDENFLDGLPNDFPHVVQLIDDRNKIIRGTRRIKEVLGHLGDPQYTIPVIMVGGTNGKTSTSYFISQILRGFGFRVGLFTSPNPGNRLRSIQISGELITQHDFTKLILEALDIDIYLTGFELEVCAAYLHFSGKHVRKVDVAVMEMGMGGKGDAVNVRSPDVAVITNVSNDHAAYLGDTIREITLEKGDIIPVNGTLVTGAIPPALDLLKEIAGKRDTKVIIPDLNRFEVTHKRDFPSYQTRNLALALEAVRSYIGTIDHTDITSDFSITNDFQDDLMDIVLDMKPPPGRFQIREIDNDIHILFDGAHNSDGFSVLFHEIQNLINTMEPVNIAVVLGIMSDKDIAGMARHTSEIHGKYLCCRSSSERAEDPEIIAKELRIFHDDVCLINRTCDAIDAAMEYLEPTGGLVVISGSLYTVEEAMQYIDEK